MCFLNIKKRKKENNRNFIFFISLLVVLTTLVFLRSNIRTVLAEDYKPSQDFKIKYEVDNNTIETYNNKKLEVNFTIATSQDIPDNYYPSAFYYQSEPKYQDRQLILGEKIENYCYLSIRKTSSRQFTGNFTITDPDALNIDSSKNIYIMIGIRDTNNPSKEEISYFTSSENETEDPAILTVKINKSLSATVTKTLPSLHGLSGSMDSWFAKIKFSNNEPITINGEKYHQAIFIYRERKYDDLIDAVASEDQVFSSSITNKTMEELIKEDQETDNGTWYQFKKNFTINYVPNEPFKIKVGLINEKYLNDDNKIPDSNVANHNAIILNETDENNYFWAGPIVVKAESSPTNIVLNQPIDWKIDVFPECFSRFIQVENYSNQQLHIEEPAKKTESPLVYKVTATEALEYPNSIYLGYKQEVKNDLGWNYDNPKDYILDGQFTVVDELKHATDIKVDNIENNEVTIVKGDTLKLNPSLVPSETTDSLSYEIENYLRDDPKTQVIKPEDDSPYSSQNNFNFVARKYGDQKIILKANDSVTKEITVHVRYRLQSTILENWNIPAKDGGEIKISGNEEFQGTTFNQLMNTEEVTLQAIPKEGYRFVAWQLLSTDSSVTLVPNAYEFMEGTNQYSTTVKLKILDNLTANPVFTKNPTIINGNEDPTLTFIESNNNLLVDLGVCEFDLKDQIIDKQLNYIDVIVLDNQNNILNLNNSLNVDLKQNGNKVELTFNLKKIDETISFPLKAYLYIDTLLPWPNNTRNEYFNSVSDSPTIIINYKKNEEIEEFKIVDREFNDETEQGVDQSLTNVADGSSKTLSHSTEEDFVSEVEIKDVPNDFYPIALVTKNDQPVTGAEFKGAKVVEAAGLKTLSSEGTSDWKMTLKIPRQNDKDVVKVQYGLVNSESLSGSDNLANPEPRVSNKLIISNANYQIEFKGNSSSEDQPGDNPNPNPDPKPDPKPEPVPGTNPGSGSSSSPGSGGNSAPNTPIVTGVFITGPDRIEMVQGDSKRLTATLAPQGVTGKITWTSSNSKVVTVDSQGGVKAIGEGISVITAQCGSFRDTVEVTVIKKEASDKVTGIAIKGGSVIKMKQNETRKLTVDLEPASSSGTVNWTSSNSNVATVDRNGSVTAKGAGNCTITAECDGHKAVIQVIVEEESRLVYRLYNEESGEHLFTSDLNEYNTLPNMGWTQEGTGWTAPNSGTPVYRLYNPALADHLYTSDSNEVKVLSTERGWQVDNNNQPLFYSGGNRPIYRLYHEGTLKHLLTKDHNEYKVLGENGWSQEGQKLSALK